MFLHLFSPLLAWSFPSGSDMMVLAILVLVLFGAKKLPRFGQSLGRSMGEFRRAKEDFDRAREDFERGRHESSGDERNPHDSVNMLLTLFFVLSLLFLGLSTAMQIMVKH